jgi:hypothetical protein
LKKEAFLSDTFSFTGNLLSPPFPDVFTRNKRFEDAVLDVNYNLYSPNYVGIDEGFYDQVTDEQKVNNKQAIDNRFFKNLNSNNKNFTMNL